MIEKLLLKMSKIDNDKLLHIFYGVAIYSIFALYSPLVAIVVTIIVATLKEIYDMKKGGDFDILDIKVTIFIPIILFIGSSYGN